jgi:hypothetical protein
MKKTKEGWNCKKKKNKLQKSSKKIVINSDKNNMNQI